MARKLEGKIAVLTGGTSGIGLGFVAEVVREPGEKVQVSQMPPVHRRQHAQRNGKVLP